MTRSISPLTLLLGLLLITTIGCAGQTPGDPGLPPDDGTPGATGDFEQTDRFGTVSWRGKVTLQGTVANSTSYTKPPYVLTIPAVPGQALSLWFKAEHLTPTTRNCMLRVLDNGVEVEAETTTGNGGMVLMSVQVATGPTLEIQFYNSASPAGTQHPDALVWSGNVFISTPTTDPEPDSDGDPDTLDDFILSTRPILEATGSTDDGQFDTLSLFSSQQQDLEDWWQFEPSAINRRLEFNPVVDATDPWTFLLRGVTASGGLLFESEFGDTSAFVVPPTPESVFIQVTGKPVNPYSKPTGHLRTYEIDRSDSGVQPEYEGLLPQPNNPIGYPGDIITLTALYKGAITYSWSSEDPTIAKIVTPIVDIQHPQLQLLRPGTTRVGFTTSGNSEFPITVGFKVPPTFATQTVTTASPGGQYFDVALVNNGTRIAVCYQDGTNEDLYFTRTVTLEPDGPEDWRTHRIAGANGARVGRWCNMAVINNIPIIAHFNETSNVMSIARGGVALPASSTDWINHTMDLAGTGRWPRVIGHNNRVTLLYQGPSESLRYAQATSAFPAGKLDYVKHDIALGPRAGYGGAIALVAVDEVKMPMVVAMRRSASDPNADYIVQGYVATIALPTQTSNWSPMTDIPSATVGPRSGDFDQYGVMSMAGNGDLETPIACFGVFDATTSGYRIWSSHSPGVNGRWNSDFPGTLPLITDGVGGHAALEWLDGRPSLALRNQFNNDLLLGRPHSDNLLLQSSVWLTAPATSSIVGFPAQMESEGFTGAIHSFDPIATGVHFTAPDTTGW